MCRKYFKVSIMDNFTAKKYVEHVLYILNKAGGLDYYRLFKIMYFAQRAYLKEYGLSIFPDRFCALPNGPAPSMLYDAIKQSQYTPITTTLNEAVVKGSDDAFYMLIPTRQAEMKYISEAARETIDWAFSNYYPKTFNQLKEESHTKVWEAAYNAGGKEMLPYDIAREANANEEALESIQNDLSFKQAFQCV